MSLRMIELLHLQSYQGFEGHNSIKQQKKRMTGSVTGCDIFCRVNFLELMDVGPIDAK